jgi:hypothetical protein
MITVTQPIMVAGLIMAGRVSSEVGGGVAIAEALADSVAVGDSAAVAALAAVTAVAVAAVMAGAAGADIVKPLTPSR